jgi:potassium efflux system protein
MTRLGAGERYAYATIAKYVVALGGVALACDRIGIGWGSVQWLVAAVGLGLGFGLQEIFANFVSGVILLLERPIRVGDTVTIGELSGTVSKIRTRATWITGADRKVLIVPNKEFVTGRLVNWTLTDTVLRLMLPVGVAYGSDVEQALALLRRAAQENELVLKQPAPAASFLRFGESALELELTCMCPDADAMGPIRHSLLLAIDRSFREAGIEGPVPQREVRIKGAAS